MLLEDKVAGIIGTGKSDNHNILPINPKYDNKLFCSVPVILHRFVLNAGRNSKQSCVKFEVL